MRRPAAWIRSRKGKVNWQTGQVTLKKASATGPSTRRLESVASPRSRRARRNSGAREPGSINLRCRRAAISRVYNGGSFEAKDEKLIVRGCSLGVVTFSSRRASKVPLNSIEDPGTNIGIERGQCKALLKYSSIYHRVLYERPSKFE